MTLRVGLTGGLASGKTTVANMFASRGAYLMHADRVGHELMEPGQPAYNQVVERFGESIVNPDKTINRAKLAEAAFGLRRIEELNKIIHPAVRERMERWFEEMSDFDPRSVLVFEAALILEAGFGKYFDKLVVVTSHAQQKLDRFALRALGTDMAEVAARAEAFKDAERRLGAQLSEQEKVAAADYVIDNSGTLTETERQVTKIFKELQQLAARSHRSVGSSPL